MFLLLLLFSFVYANNCNERTSYYNGILIGDFDYYYYDHNTYTENIKSMSIEEYKLHIISTVPCTGKWCVNGKWPCKYGDSKNCYNVEHIIPTMNNIKALIGCSLNIQGNMIKAYGAWNQALSNEYFGEKAIIYGSIFKSAYKSVYTACHNQSPTYYPEELCLPIFNIFNAMIVILLIIFIIIIVAIIIYKKYNFEN